MHKTTCDPKGYLNELRYKLVTHEQPHKNYFTRLHRYGHVDILKLIGQCIVCREANKSTTACHFWYTLNSAPLTVGAFAPFQVLHQMLYKNRETVLLVEPKWPTCTWFLELVHLLEVLRKYSGICFFRCRGQADIHRKRGSHVRLLNRALYIVKGCAKQNWGTWTRDLDSDCNCE